MRLDNAEGLWQAEMQTLEMLMRLGRQMLGQLCAETGSGYRGAAPRVIDSHQQRDHARSGAVNSELSAYADVISIRRTHCPSISLQPISFAE